LFDWSPALYFPVTPLAVALTGWVVLWRKGLRSGPGPTIS